ncbi:hypothetical protein AO073_01740 [Pseudomonas syringae ICMP 11293]|uniref:hypothetical protein n=1 Tax=Pseudomonas syringae TaxID=317 RepID=UPI00072FCEEF|nr:hypothetical protein [Pseudomonas syringae]KTB91621.1 hypothetical protein AO073_01740 [Pseudomonas syringae ICMP 11293]
MNIHTSEEAYLADTSEDSMLITHKEISDDFKTQSTISQIKRHFTDRLGEIKFYNLCYIYSKRYYSKQIFAIHQDLKLAKHNDVYVEILEIAYNPKTKNLCGINGRAYTVVEEINLTFNGKSVEIIDVIMSYFQFIQDEKYDDLSFLDFLNNVNFNQIYDYHILENY